MGDADKSLIHVCDQLQFSFSSSARYLSLCLFLLFPSPPQWCLIYRNLRNPSFGMGLSGKASNDVNILPPTPLPTLMPCNISIDSEIVDTPLEGSLPSEWGLLSSLERLSLSSSNLEGTFPSSFGQLSQLRYLSRLPQIGALASCL